MIHVKVDLAGARLAESEAPNEDGEIRIRVCRTYDDSVEFIVDKEGADNARHLAAMLLGAAENRDPKGYRLELPEADLTYPEEAENLIDRASA